MSNSDFEVTVEDSYDKRGNNAVLVKIATAVIELNIHLPLSHLPKVFSVANSQRFYCDAGESANSPVHWKKESPEEVYILVGDDQDVWDICLLIPNETFAEIISQIRATHPNL
jgi:hypothetical protein